MKILSLLTAFTFLLLFSCEDGLKENISNLEEVESAAPSDNGATHVYPMEMLFSQNISNGFFYAVDNQGQAITFIDGSIVCAQQMPADQFQELVVRPEAPDGIYGSLTGEMFELDEGAINSVWNKTYNCIEKTVFIDRDCPQGQLGFDRYLVKNCYWHHTSILLSSDTTFLSSIPCVPIEAPVFGPYTFEDAYGNKYINPFCF